MKRLITALSLTLMLSALALARDAAALKTDLASMMPAGKTEIRLAWIKGGGFTEFAWYASSNAVFKVSSTDGVITQLYPKTGIGDFCNVSVAANGKRVFFFNKSSGKVGVINWDGTGFKEVDVGGNMFEYWCDPVDSSDWVIVTRNGMSRVKVDAPSTAVQVMNGDYGEDGVGLSDDGKLFLAYGYDKSPTTFSIVNSSTFVWTMGPHGGCQGSLSGGASPKYHHNPSGHTELCLHDAKNQTQFTVYKTAAATSTWLTQIGQKLPSCESFVSNEGARMTQDPNYATYCISQSKVNPILVRVGSPLKMIYIDDNLSCTFCGDMDAVFLSGPVTATKNIPQSTALAPRAGFASAAYSLDGRRLDRNAGGYLATMRGVVVRRTEGARGAASLDVQALTE